MAATLRRGVQGGLHRERLAGDRPRAVSYRRCVPSHCAALLVFLCLAGTASADLSPSVARAFYGGSDESQVSGTVFFLQAPEGPVAVGAAHSFDLEKLTETGSVEFRAASRRTRMGHSNRYFVPPGTTFRAPGGTLRDDYIVFALNGAPAGAHALEIDRVEIGPGVRIRLLGIPVEIPQDQDDLFGTVIEVNPTRIEVELDAPADLRGWGGAPVLRAADDRVVGILQAALPSRTGFRIGVAPISGVVEALAHPLDDGAGRPFAAFSGRERWREPAPAPDSASAPGATGRRRSIPTPTPQIAIPTTEDLFGKDDREARLLLEIETPANESLVGDATGVFVAGHALALLGEFRRFDVMFVIDTSGSTNEPSGADVNGNGVVGESKLGAVGGLLGLGSSDRGDSILAAEIEAARTMLRGLDARSTRIGVVTFAGEPDGARTGMFKRRPPRAAVTEEPLTTDYARIERSLERIRERGAYGLTHMAAGVDQSMIELVGLRGSVSETDVGSEKIVLFFTDGQPTLPYENFEADNVRAVLRAADRAKRAGIRIHSFAIGADALSGPVATVEMAARTDGVFTPVRHPGDLVDVVQDISFANIEDLVVRNTTTEVKADPVLMNADGSFSALVPVVPGTNQIEVIAVATGGLEAREKVKVVYAKDAPAPSLPPELVVQRTRLLERKLVDLRRARMEAEQQVAEETRKELRIEIERERALARERADQQRKELEIEAERSPPTAP